MHTRFWNALQYSIEIDERNGETGPIQDRPGVSGVGIHLDPMDTQCAGNCCALEQMPQFQTPQSISNSFKQFQTISNNFCISMHFMNFMDLDVSIPHAHCFQAPWQWHCFGCVKGSRKVVSTVFFETNLTTPCYPNFQFATTCHFLCRRVSNSILQIKLVAKPDDERVWEVCPGLGCLGLCPENSVWLEAGEFLFVLKWTFTDRVLLRTVTYCYVLFRSARRYFGVDRWTRVDHGQKPHSAPGVDVLARCAEVPCQARKLQRKAVTRFNNLSISREITLFLQLAARCISVVLLDIVGLSSWL